MPAEAVQNEAGLSPGGAQPVTGSLCRMDNNYKGCTTL